MLRYGCGDTVDGKYRVLVLGNVGVARFMLRGVKRPGPPSPPPSIYVLAWCACLCNARPSCLHLRTGSTGSMQTG